jgi:hypothetical protein
MSWSDEADVARGFATSQRSFYQGGTVILEADVPSSAILCAPAEMAAAGALGEDEREYMVDRRLLRTVRVIERLP